MLGTRRAGGFLELFYPRPPKKELRDESENNAMQCRVRRRTATQDNEPKDAKAAQYIKLWGVGWGGGAAERGDTPSDPVHITCSHLCRHVHESEKGSMRTDEQVAANA